MNDHPAQPAPDTATIQTIAAVLTDLAEVYAELPLLTGAGQADPGQSEQSAQILDHLAGELAEAASMVRGTVPAALTRAARDVRVAEARRHIAMFPRDPDLPVMPPAALAGWAARMHTAAMLLDAWIRDREQAADPRIMRARSLAAEQHQALAMSPGDLRALLARYQRGVIELLAALDGEPAREERGDR